MDVGGGAASGEGMRRFAPLPSGVSEVKLFIPVDSIVDCDMKDET